MHRSTDTNALNETSMYLSPNLVKFCIIYGGKQHQGRSDSVQTLFPSQCKDIAPTIQNNLANVLVIHAQTDIKHIHTDLRLINSSTHAFTTRSPCNKIRGLLHMQTHLPPSGHSAPWLSPSLALGWGRPPPHVSDASRQVKLEDSQDEYQHPKETRSMANPRVPDVVCYCYC